MALMLMTTMMTTSTQGNTEIRPEREPIANVVVDNDNQKEAKC